MDAGALQTEWPSCFPELATERLRLRAPLQRDAPALLGILGDPEVTRYINMPTLTTLAEAHAALERLEQRYTARDTIRWAIELVDHGEMIGTVGLLRFDFEHRRAERRARCPRTRASTSRRMRRTRGDLRSAHEGLPRALIGFGGWRRLRLTAGRRGLRVDSDRGGGRPDTYQGITNVDMPSLSPQSLACPR
jgi:Acetyltransferase (GNAT) domain